MADMTKTAINMSHLFRNKAIYFFFAFVLLIILFLFNNKCNKKVFLERKLQGTWNICWDRCTWKRKYKYHFIQLPIQINENLLVFPSAVVMGDNKTQSFMSIHTPLDSNSLSKGDYEQWMCLWSIVDSDYDSIQISCKNSPYDGKYKLCFFKEYDTITNSIHFFLSLRNDSTNLTLEKEFSWFWGRPAYIDDWENESR